MLTGKSGYLRNKTQTPVWVVYLDFTQTSVFQCKYQAQHQSFPSEQCPSTVCKVSLFVATFWLHVWVTSTLSTGRKTPQHVHQVARKTGNPSRCIRSPTTPRENDGRENEGEDEKSKREASVRSESFERYKKEGNKINTRQTQRRIKINHRNKYK